LAMSLGSRLHQAGIRPSAQRLAIADYVLQTDHHPSADRVYDEVRSRVPMVSRATVYNTLNLFVDKGLLRRFYITDGRVAFDCNTAPHHHLVDETGAVHDISPRDLRVEGVADLQDFDVHDVHVVLHGRRREPERA
ncbi:MAG: Fur family transcriptional regulator, partial [Myxococcota bacterium]